MLHLYLYAVFLNPLQLQIWLCNSMGNAGLILINAHEFSIQQVHVR
jgi:hypothetical protein